MSAALPPSFGQALCPPIHSDLRHSEPGSRNLPDKMALSALASLRNTDTTQLIRPTE